MNNSILVACLSLIIIGLTIAACDRPINEYRKANTASTPFQTAIIITSTSKQRLQLTWSMPAITPSPTSINQLERSGCIDDMDILESFQPAQKGFSGLVIVWPGEDYSLTWRIRNTGTCIWDSVYRFVPTNNKYGGLLSQPIPLKDRVDPRRSVEVQFSLTAPLQQGDYTVGWGLYNGYGKQLGSFLAVTIRVPADSSNEPLPTQTGIPNIQFNANKTKVAADEKVVISWDVKRAKAVYLFSTGQTWQANPVPKKGVRTAYIKSDTTYKLRVVNMDNTVQNLKIFIEVYPPLGLPKIEKFELLPKGQVLNGECVRIEWKVIGGRVTLVQLMVDAKILLPRISLSGDYVDCPIDVGLKVYTLIASGPGGVVCKSKGLNVINR